MKKYKCDRNGTVINVETGKIVKQTIKNGYAQIRLGKNFYYVHRLVAMEYIPNPLNLPQVNHKNGIKTDNHIENLEWCSAQENITLAIKTGLTVNYGENNSNHILTNKQVLEIRAKFIPFKYTYKMLANEYGVSYQTIARILCNTMWKHL